MLAADRSFFSLDNDRSAQAAGGRTVAVPRPGPLSAERHRVEHPTRLAARLPLPPWDRGPHQPAQGQFGLARCHYHGETGLERWVGLGILAHNLRQISRSVAVRRVA